MFDGLGASANGTWSLSVYAPAGNTGSIECWTLHVETDAGQSLDFSNDVPEPLYNPSAGSGGPGVGSSSVNASGLTGQISAVTATVWVSHPEDGDLDVILVSPDDIEVKLAARVGGNGSDFGASCTKPTVFDDAGKTAIASGTAPFQGTFRPSAALANFKGWDGNGTWTLRVVDNAATHVGQINCWSLTVTSTTTTSSAGLVLTTALSAPHPLPGSFVYPTFSVKNDSAAPMTNVKLSSTLPSTLSGVREDPVDFPDCDVNIQVLTCVWPSVAPGETVYGGALAKVGASKQGKVCVDGSATATGVSAVKRSACFTYAAYASPDGGNGYDIGDKAHNLALQDQNVRAVKLSDYAGKYVLLQFTASWCGPSNQEVPQDRDEVAALNSSNAMGVKVVYLDALIDGPTTGHPSTQQDALDWVAKFGLTTPVLFTLNDVTLTARQEGTSYGAVAGELTLPSFPTSIFIRPDGTIFDVRIGIDNPLGTSSTTSRFLADR